jgi:eukaryotic-like serine/threonine-protein kinase
MSAPAGPPQRGEVIAGKYVVDDVLGAGGMGIVVAAHHAALRQRVAIKVLQPQAAGVPEASKRFLREARAAASIQSEHVARVLDVGTLDTGARYMVMEFLAGTDLAKRIKQGGALPIADAVDFVLQACEAVAEAHVLGIAHRDLKPANLFLTTRAEGSPLVKVLDFGLSKMVDDDGVRISLTATDFVMGSPQYMSPEQLRSLKDADWRTDIWAVGVILYEFLTGKRPFDGPSLTAVSASIMVDTPKPIGSLRPGVPAALEVAVLKCIEKDPALRWQSIGELAQAIAPFAPPSASLLVERILRLQPVAATPAGPPTATLSAVPLAADATAGLQVEHTTARTSAWGSTGPAPKDPPKLWIAGGMGAAAVLVGVFAWALHARMPGSPAAVAATTTTAAESPSAPPPVVTPAPMISTTAAVVPSAPASAPSTKPAATSGPAAPPKVTSPVAPKPSKRPNPLDRPD